MTGSSAAERTHIWRFRYQGPRNGIGYTFCPLRGGLAVENAEQIFIYDEDFTEPIQIIKRQYPLDEEYAGEGYEAFDACWDNPIPADVWFRIFEELEALHPDDPEAQSFIRTFIEWARAALQHADGIEIVGNL